jgi:hypothetical protein
VQPIVDHEAGSMNSELHRDEILRVLNLVKLGGKLPQPGLTQPKQCL